jgi:hypothetical protein
MADSVLLDECSLSFRIPKDLDDAACDAIRRILESRQFRSALRRAVREIIRQSPELAPVRVRISV